MLDPELNDAELKLASEQTIKLLPHFAKVARQYFLELKKQDFSDKEALKLTSDYMCSLGAGG